MLCYKRRFRERNAEAGRRCLKNVLKCKSQSIFFSPKMDFELGKEASWFVNHRSINMTNFFESNDAPNAAAKDATIPPLSPHQQKAKV